MTPALDTCVTKGIYCDFSVIAKLKWISKASKIYGMWKKGEHKLFVHLEVLYMDS